MKERLYLGGFEIYREYDAGGGLYLERETLHVMDGQQRIALVETRTQGDDGAPAQLARYQLGNHLGSASLELDETGRIISYEEYYPYGSASYQAVGASIKAAAKRYQYTGKERDEETGLNYHVARYYACWLGRWISCDPAGLIDGLNIYSIVMDNPSSKIDSNGNWTDEAVPPPKIKPVPGPNSPPDIYPFPETQPQPNVPRPPLRPAPIPLVNPWILPLIFLQPDNPPEASANKAGKKSETGADIESDIESDTELDTDSDSPDALTQTETDDEPEDSNLHHIATDKSKRWTPRFKVILDNASMDFDEPSNLVEIEGHQGPHPDEYHQLVYDRLKNAVDGIDSSSYEYADAVVTALSQMEEELMTPGTELNRLVRTPDPKALARMIRAREEKEMFELLQDAYDPLEPGEAYIPEDEWSMPWCRLPIPPDCE
jgi:RHS repeat-associated protein